MLTLILAAIGGFLLGVLLMILLFAAREAENVGDRLEKRKKVKQITDRERM